MADDHKASDNVPRVRIQEDIESITSPTSTSPDRRRQGARHSRNRSNSERFASNPFERFDERRSRPQNTEDADETTRLLTEDSRDVTPRATDSHDRASPHDTHLPAPSIRYRLNNSNNPSPSPVRPRGSTLNLRKSIAVSLATGRDGDATSHKFSLAGPATIDTLVANQNYVDPGYAQLNPAYEQPTNTRPVWGLAKPLPRVIRPGMVPTTSELHQEFSQLRNQDPTDLDVEQGRIEPSLRYDKLSSQLDQVRQEREISLVESYRHASGFSSPYGRRNSGASRTTGIYSPRHASIIPEEEEGSTIQEFPQLSEAIANVEDSKPPYEDAIPLRAYDAADIDEVHNLHTYWSVIRLRYREPLAEFLAITVQLTLGFSTNLAITVSRGKAGVGDTADWAWGLATMVAIYIAGGISGAHLNPAMSTMLYIYRGFPLRKIPSYVIAQFLGGFLAAIISFSIFKPGIIALGEPNLVRSGTSANFITFPRADWVDGRTAFATEVTGTCILAIAVLALGDDANAPPGAGMNALIIGLIVVVLSMAFGWNNGLAMNPVRDFGPRVALLVLGYSDVFADNYWFTVAWLGPLTGAILGGFLYDAAIFVGGESPVNYPPKRIKRAAYKWKKRTIARFRRTKRKMNEVKDDVAYGVMDRA